MNEFLLVFRNTPQDNGGAQMSPDQMQAMMKPWQDWLGGIAAQNKLVTGGNRLANEGNVIKTNKMVTNGPYVEMKETVGGYSIIKAESLEEATELAKGCPILANGGNVEVRQIVGM